MFLLPGLLGYVHRDDFCFLLAHASPPNICDRG
jgi:hypothetical protein